MTPSGTARAATSTPAIDSRRGRGSSTLRGRPRAAWQSSDRRAADALASLGADRRADGRWHADGRYWRGRGTTGTGVEAVPWGADGEARMLTIQALELLVARR